jgi:hypothetical protein
VSDADKILNDRQATRFDFDPIAASAFVRGDDEVAAEPTAVTNQEDEDSHPEPPIVDGSRADPRERKADVGDRVFITHGKNRKILEQVKELVAFGKFEPIIAKEHEATSKPVPEKVLEDMRSCEAAVIHVGSEGMLLRQGRERIPDDQR